MDALIEQLDSDDALREAVSIIREAFLTVAEDYNITKENCPTYAAFRTFEQLKALHEDGVVMFSAFEGDRQKAAGFVCISRNDNNSYTMGLLSVLPEHRHKGYGKMLMNFTYNYVKGLGGEKLRIWLMDENRVLKDWYIDYGFKVVSVEKSDKMPFTICSMEKYIL